MREQTLKRVRHIAADILSVSPGGISAESTPQHIESWDSVQHLNLVMAVEEEFSIQFSPEDFDRMKSIGALASLVDAKRGNG